ncbi:MAG: hypothetical protein N2489_11810, partial [Clostridia bacterium]|nr:hypothetical protein [Clostridia bacterium]
ILKPKCQGGHFEYHVTRRHIDACEELQDKSLVISSKFQKMGSCGRINFILRGRQIYDALAFCNSHSFAV